MEKDLRIIRETITDLNSRIANLEHHMHKQGDKEEITKEEYQLKMIDGPYEFNGYIIGEIKDGEIKIDKTLLWDLFSNLVYRHIDEYVGKQYSPYYPDGMIENWDNKNYVETIDKYNKRTGRSEQDKLVDLLKMAHYLCYQYFYKLNGNKLPGIFK